MPDFTGSNLLMAYTLSLAPYFAGEFNITYLYLALVFTVVGVVWAWLFAGYWSDDSQERRGNCSKSIDR